MSRLDALLQPLVDAALAECIPIRGDGREGLEERLRPAMAEALRAQVSGDGGQAPEADRLNPDKLRRDARTLLDTAHRGGQHQEYDNLTELVADLLRQVREADQRERWIRQSYSHSATMYEAMAHDALQELGQLRHSVRLVKRATRHVTVGRE